MRFNKFSTRASVIIIPCLLIIFLIYAVCFIKLQQQTIKEEVIKRAGTFSSALSIAATQPLSTMNSSQIRDMVNSIKNMPDVTSAVLYNDKYQILSGDPAPDGPANPEPDGLKMTILEDRDHFDVCTPVISTVKRGGIDDRYTGMDPDGKKEMLGWLRVGFSKKGMDAAGRRIIARSLFITLLVASGCSVLVYLLISYTSRPISRLLSAAENNRGGDDCGIMISSPDELAGLAREFNLMLREIRHRDEKLLSWARFNQFRADMDKVFRESLSLDEMIEKTAEVFRIHTDSTHVGIWLNDRGDEVLHLQTTAGTPEFRKFLPDSLTLQDIPECMKFWDCHTCGADGSTIKCRWIKVPEGIADSQIRYCAGYPVIADSGLVGVMGLFAREQFHYDLLFAIGTFADQLAVGLGRRAVEERMRKSLEEKEVLLREIHHRVKNNMQVISSLLNIQSETISDSRYKEMFIESRNRIRAMALIHEKLYQRRDIANIDFCDYITSLSHSLFMFYGINPGRISLKIDAPEIMLGIDTAIPCGLIINELLSNALKYAFPKDQKGIIWISMKMHRDGGTDASSYELTVRDDGAGLPEDFDIRNTRTLGLHLVTLLVEHQLRGTVEAGTDGGAIFNLHFKDAEYRKRV